MMQIIVSHGVSWDDLEWHHCRWPLESGRWCGDRKDSIAYCRHHASTAYRPQIERAGPVMFDRCRLVAEQQGRVDKSDHPAPARKRACCTNRRAVVSVSACGRLRADLLVANGKDLRSLPSLAKEQSRAHAGGS